MWPLLLPPGHPPATLPARSSSTAPPITASTSAPTAPPQPQRATPPGATQAACPSRRRSSTHPSSSLLPTPASAIAATRHRPNPPSPRSRPPTPPLETPTVMTTFPTHLQPRVLANGLLLVDKPAGWEVPEVVAAVQRATRAPKVASVAPLDPSASGLLLLCFGAATRMAPRVERAVKRYEGSLVLGGVAACGDVRGGSYMAAAMPWQHIADDEELQEAADAILALAAGSGAQGIDTSPGTRDGGEVTTDDPDGSTAGSESDDAVSENGPDSGDSSSSSRGGGSSKGVEVQVLPPRFKLRQLPGSSNFIEEDDGVSICTTPLSISEFRVWSAPQDGPLLTPHGPGAGWAGRLVDTRAPPHAGSGPLGRHTPGVSVAHGAGARGRARSLGSDASRLHADPWGVRELGAGRLRRPAGPQQGSGGGPGREGLTVRFSLSAAGRMHIRSLVMMYGRRLRTTACLDELRRTAVGGLSVGDAWALESLLPVLKRYQR